MGPNGVLLDFMWVFVATHNKTLNMASLGFRRVLRAVTFHKSYK